MAAFEQLEDRRLYHAGALDTTFSGDGIVTTTPGGSFVVASMDTRGGRTVVLGGTGQPEPGVVSGPANIVAYNNSGNIDTAFSGDGLRPIPRLTNPSDIFIQPDGKIVLVGTVDGVAGVARLLPNGAADTSFSGDGFVTIPQMTQATGVRLTSANKIVISGYAPNGVDPAFAAARLNVNGSMDSSFSGDGFVKLNFSGQANAVAVQSDGKIVLVGWTPAEDLSDTAVARITTSGALDTSFSGDGKFVYQYSTGDQANSVDITPGGQILVGATFGPAVAGALRFNADGVLNLELTSPANPLQGGSRAIANNIRSSFDGNHIYLMVDKYNGSTVTGSVVARFDSDGTYDHTFGNDGRIDGSGEGHGDLQADGKLITAGNPVIGGPQADTMKVQGRRRITAIDPADRIGAGDEIYVEGTTGDDTITVTRDSQTGELVITLNGKTERISTTAFSRILIEGNKGNDTIDTRNADFFTYIDGGAGNDNIKTGKFSDTIHGGEGNDTINAGAGTDEVWGEAGDDLLQGGNDNDTLYAGKGRDRVYGGAGDDKLSGMQPTLVDHLPDYLDGGTGTDTVKTKEDEDATFSIELED